MRNGSIIALGLTLFFIGLALLFSFVYLPEYPVSFFRAGGVLGWFFIAMGLVATYIGIYRYVHSGLPEWEGNKEKEIPKWVEVTEGEHKKPESLMAKKSSRLSTTDTPSIRGW